MHTAMWIIPIAPFILAIATTWNFREAIEETVWFNVAYIGTLALIYALEVVGLGFISTSPTGSGGLIAMVAGFVAQGVQRYRWKQERRRLAIIKAQREKEQRATRVAAGQPAERSVVTDAFGMAGQLYRQRKNLRRSRQ